MWFPNPAKVVGIGYFGNDQDEAPMEIWRHFGYLGIYVKFGKILAKS